MKDSCQTCSCNKQCEQIPIGNVAFWITHRTSGYWIEWGIVREHYNGETVCELYDFYDNRIINGIPIKDFYTPTKWNKFPKDWTYSTKLFEVDFIPLEELFPKYKDKKFSFSQQEIQEAISDGILVSRSKQDNCYFDDEIDKDKGWRIIRKYPNTNHSCSFTTIEFHKLFSTYEEAEQELNKYNGQMKQQSEMSDYDWAVQDIDETLNRWQKNIFYFRRYKTEVS